jgi:DNA polymerase V
MQLLAEEADIEVYSIDEAFLHIPSWHPCTAPHLLSYGEHLTQFVMQELGIPVSIGMAPTKVLAKVASYAAKHPTIFKKFMPQNFSTFFKDPLSGEILFGQGPREVFILPAHLKELTPHPLLAQIKIEHLWGIGHASAVELRLQGIATADQLRCSPGLGQLSLPLQQIIFELRGEPVFTNEPPTAQKSFLHSRSFAPPLTTLPLVQDTLRSFINKLAGQLREQDSTCQKIKVFWVRGHTLAGNLTPFEERQAIAAEFKFLDPTSDTRKLIKAGEKLLASLGPMTTVYRLGAELSMIYPNTVHGQNFLEEYDTPQSDQLMQVVDQINAQQGAHAINFGHTKMKKAKDPTAAPTLPILATTK